eukprot:429150-Pyramimonas_sp.AAC.1
MSGGEGFDCYAVNYKFVRLDGLEVIGTEASDDKLYAKVVRNIDPLSKVMGPNNQADPLCLNGVVVALSVAVVVAVVAAALAVLITNSDCDGSRIRG